MDKAVTLRDSSMAHRVFPEDAGSVTVLSPTVNSVISISVPATSMATLYHRKCHFRTAPGLRVQSQKPFLSDVHQTSKDTMLG